MHKDYGIFKRIVKGKTIYYYYVYDKEGNRRFFSTGQRTKSAAETYCLQLYKNDALIPRKKDKTLFHTYVKDFWNYDKSPYIQGILKRGGSFSRTVADWRELMTKKHLFPTFCNMRLSSITPQDIESWLLSYDEAKISNTTVNKCLLTLKIILKQAVKDGLIAENPCDNVKPLKENPREKGILTIEEAKKLMNPDTAELYWDNKTCYVGNLLAMTTGLRHGEIIALQKQDVFPDHLVITHSYDSNYGLKDTKTHKSREVIIHPLIYKLMCDITPEEGFIFSLQGGKRPVSPKIFGMALKKALIKLGLTKEEIKERNITFHSWRHFANTVMRARNVPDPVVQSITGHSTAQMTEHYSHFNLEHQKAIMDYQRQLIAEKDIK